MRLRLLIPEREPLAKLPRPNALGFISGFSLTEQLVEAAKVPPGWFGVVGCPSALPPAPPTA